MKETTIEVLTKAFHERRYSLASQDTTPGKLTVIGDVEFTSTSGRHYEATLYYNDLGNFAQVKGEPGWYKVAILPEIINHPAHYGGGDNPYEAIKVIEAWKLGFNLGNTVKYIARSPHKGSTLEDLKKARWYLDREITNLENSRGKD